jgi:2-isopropylmalate synthase
VRLRGPGGHLAVQAAVGTGPVDAAFKAIDLIVGAPVTLVEYQVHSVTEGIDALGHVNVKLREPASHGAITAQSDAPRPRVFHGAAADTDIVVASAKAYLRALNRMFAAGVGITHQPLAERAS